MKHTYSSDAESLATRYILQYSRRTKSTVFPSFDLSLHAEILASPVKYAIFEVLGYEFIRGFGISSRVSGSLRSSAIIGALGGGVLTMVHLALSFKYHNTREDYSTLRSLSTSLLQALWKETIFSLFAAIIGATLSGVNSSDDLRYTAVAGVVGPILALAVMFGILGVIIGVVWSVERLRGFVSRY
ncbi:hypothetical protein BJ912DRAFT_137966 [Pholiota molesta]|nr:hypothetical protein BJ912DRAFT_137966 [Pholiota molesta]